VRGGLQAIPRGKPSGQCLGTEYATSGFVDCSAASCGRSSQPLSVSLLGYLRILPPFAVWLVGVDSCSFDFGAAQFIGRYAEVYYSLA